MKVGWMVEMRADLMADLMAQTKVAMLVETLAAKTVERRAD